MAKIIDLVGKKFARLYVIERAKNKGEKTMWLCECECGKKCVVDGCNLRNGHTQSCGCLQKERLRQSRKTHGKSKNRLYTIWSNMKNRCFNPNDKVYLYYGNRGITVCEDWKNDFQIFYEWAINNGYEKHLTIERIDNNGDYCPENCRWVTRTEQQNNRRNNHYITYNGETLTITQWANKLGVNPKLLFARINDYKWDIEKALTKTS